MPTATSTPACLRARDELAQVVHAPGFVRRLHQRAEHAIAERAPFSSRSPTTSSMPSGSARARRTSIVCGKHESATKNCGGPPTLSIRFACTRCSIVIASAAAVASSSSDALATSIPVRSRTIVWKLRSASSRPCAISA